MNLNTMNMKNNIQRQYRLIGGISAIAWVVLQVIGDVMHPRLPTETTETLHCISQSPVWLAAHLVLLFDYIVLVPMTVAFSRSFGQGHWANSLAIPLVIIAVTLGIVQVSLHPTALKILADQYTGTGGAHTVHMGGSSEFVILLFKGLWSYNIAMEFIHLLVLYLVIFLFAIQMQKNPMFKKWLSVLGITGSVVAIVALIVGEVILKRSKMGDLIIFGLGMLPLAVWLVVTGIALIRYKEQPTVAFNRQVYE
jgi:hypothetical protein